MTKVNGNGGFIPYLPNSNQQNKVQQKPEQIPIVEMSKTTSVSENKGMDEKLLNSNIYPGLEITAQKIKDLEDITTLTQLSGVPVTKYVNGESQKRIEVSTNDFALRYNNFTTESHMKTFLSSPFIDILNKVCNVNIT